MPDAHGAVLNSFFSVFSKLYSVYFSENAFYSTIDSALCGACQYRLAASEIPVWEMPFAIEAWPLAVRWVFSDQSPIRSVHHAFKYEGRPELADLLIAGLLPALVRILQQASPDVSGKTGEANEAGAADETHTFPSAVIVPVPSHRLRILERGYCQAAVLAGRAARHLGCRAAPGALARREHAGSQTRLHARQRLENVHAAFEVRDTPDGDPIIILDDVITTGATLHACATRLEAAIQARSAHAGSAQQANSAQQASSAKHARSVQHTRQHLRPSILLAAPALRPPLPIGRTIHMDGSTEAH